MSWLSLPSRLAAVVGLAVLAAFASCAPAAKDKCTGPYCNDNNPGITCSPGQIVCGNTCVDTGSDPANCGQCGNVCTAGLFCSQSACSGSCAAGLTGCGQSCVDLMSNAAQCGQCGVACQPGAACVAGACQAPTGTGGGSGTGGESGVGGSGTGGDVGTGGGAGNSLLGGYHVHGDWAGFAFTFVDEAKTASITPAHFEDMVDRDGPYCVKGSVAATTTYTSIGAVGFNVSQPKQEDAPVNKVASTGDGVYIDVKVNSGSTNIRVQLEDGTDPSAADAADHRWCSMLSVNPDGTFKGTLPWESFSTKCWGEDGGFGTPFDKREIAKVILYVPDPGSGAAVPFDFCVNDIGPENVTSRGTGEIVANCGTNVSWGAQSTNQQFHNIQTGDGRYRFQSNGWGWQGGGSHSISLLPANGFRMDTQTCRRTDDSPCSYPSIYIGTSADGQRSSGSNLPRLLNQITSVPTCMGWSAGTTPATDEYNVSYDVWFNTDANGTEASKFVMVWLRDPPSFQPGGMFPIATAVIGSQLWQVWHGPNHQNRPVTSYVAPLPRANGQAYSFDLKDFFDDATERGYLNPAQDNLIAVMGGMEIWGGAQSASITSFRAEVK